MIEGRQISFRMSSEELAKMRECMAKVGTENTSEFVRKAIFRYIKKKGCA